MANVDEVACPQCTLLNSPYAPRCVVCNGALNPLALPDDPDAPVQNPSNEEEEESDNNESSEDEQETPSPPPTPPPPDDESPYPTIELWNCKIGDVVQILNLRGKQYSKYNRSNGLVVDNPETSELMPKPLVKLIGRPHEGIYLNIDCLNIASIHLVKRRPEPERDKPEGDTITM